MKLASRVVVTACAAGAAALVWTSVSAGHSGAAAATSATSAASVADEAPGYLVEDFDYPNAAKIKEEQGITLKRGDGHIVLADCGSQDGLLEIWERNRSEHICFRVTGTSGYLSLEIPAVYGIKGAADQSADVTMTTDDKTTHYDIAKNTITPVGESVDPGNDYALVEISTTK
ncbi:hypothetical protein [Streptomyces sp. CA-253872]|uniref:hypothetical protein n=1 Tax=Streptomyces sp. CA-253872 TaxID=3240067 RepID=UPI003D8D48F7